MLRWCLLPPAERAGRDHGRRLNKRAAAGRTCSLAKDGARLLPCRAVRVPEHFNDGLNPQAAVWEQEGFGGSLLPGREVLPAAWHNFHSLCKQIKFSLGKYYQCQQTEKSQIWLVPLSPAEVTVVFDSGDSCLAGVCGGNQASALDFCCW